MAGNILCNICLDLIFWRNAEVWDAGYRLIRTFNDMQTSTSTSSCPFCGAFVEQLLVKNPPALACDRVRFDVERTVRKNERQISIMILDRSDSEDPIGTFDGDNTEGRMYVPSENRSDFPEELDRHEEAGKIIGCWITKWSFPGLSDELARPEWSSGVLDMDNRFQPIDDWLNECIGGRHEEHRACHDVTIPGYPRRLLDLRGVATAECIILVETAGWSDPLPDYTTLSHCWGGVGGPRPLKTTSYNLDAHKHGISMGELPKTFRDAVTIALRIGISWLWIDSLCIVQNDTKDWESEAGRMAAVYENSFLTIAATSSTNCEGGCDIGSREAVVIEGMTPLSFATRYEGSEPGSGQKIKLKRTRTPWRKQSMRPALHTRGWALQEASLSRRILHMADHHMIWQCRQRFDQEVIDLRLSGMAGDAFRQYGFLWNARIGTTDDPYWRGTEYLVKDSTDLLNDMWWTIVKSYARREFTYPSDRLPALAGMVEYYSRKLQDASLLGLWKNTIAFDLAWSVYRGELPLERTLPTWTWLSSPGFLGPTYHYPAVMKPITLDGWNIEWERQPYVSKLLRGTLQVSSKVLETDLRNSVCSYKDIQPKLLELCAQVHPPIPVEFDVHYRSDILQAYKTEHNLQLTFMLLYIWSDSMGRKTKAVFLALLPSPSDPSMYVRIGAGSIEYRWPEEEEYEENDDSVDLLFGNWKFASLTLC